MQIEYLTLAKLAVLSSSLFLVANYDGFAVFKAPSSPLTGDTPETLHPLVAQRFPPTQEYQEPPKLVAMFPVVPAFPHDTELQCAIVTQRELHTITLTHDTDSASIAMVKTTIHEVNHHPHAHLLSAEMGVHRGIMMHRSASGVILQTITYSDSHHGFPFTYKAEPQLRTGSFAKPQQPLALLTKVSLDEENARAVLYYRRPRMDEKRALCVLDFA
ncbi:hypothetical protein DXG03_003931 [Asterophora parasitica]|uniref:Uncharacterized protein n=1 Tax=Asterophora parasitica TaxID=117018 RepID=A0A9P7G0P7_9AGAR|nr:hypothetical protein DXG03_003931 [Asterophora parasitica]